MDPDGDESSKLYKQLVEEKKKIELDANDKSESALGKEQRKLSATIIQVKYSDLKNISRRSCRK